ncbi:hypothetical protein ACFQBQ_10500 [Granulicella cerasi]|uniref:Uncharacterized protein n=1 Tax=Granulicella cerasi TaxID=741063 RepID=A0ABW1Z964_9BACT|nr:hypothetical protein [Granulicella cerasi]
MTNLVRAQEVARDAEVRQSPNGVSFATFGETGVPAVDLDSMLQAVPTSISASLEANTYFFVPLAMREADTIIDSPRTQKTDESALVAPAYTDDLSTGAICHRNVELGSGRRGVFISTRLMQDRFALSFEFFINVAHAYVDVAGIPERFSELAWQQALANVKGETSFDAWEARQLTFGRSVVFEPEPLRASRALASKRVRAFSTAKPAVVDLNANAEPASIDEKEKKIFLETAFSDAVAVFLLSLALDFDYSELREREYPLLAPGALAERLRLCAELFPPNAGYEFSVRYRRRA